MKMIIQGDIEEYYEDCDGDDQGPYEDEKPWPGHDEET